MSKRILKRAGLFVIAAVFAAGATTLPDIWSQRTGRVSAAAAPNYSFSTLTADGWHWIELVNSHPNLFIKGPGGGDKHSNYRAAIWSDTSVTSLNQQACATWVGESDPVHQQGVALRITTNGSTTKAVTITKNIWAGANWIFNAHVWDSSRGADNAFTLIGQFDKGAVMHNEIGKVKYMPWRVCARAVNNTVAFKIWFPNSMTEPSWSDARYTGVATIPATHMAPGKAGWYVGHIRNGGNIQYTDLTTTGL